MVREQRDEVLADDAGGAEDPDVDSSSPIRHHETTRSHFLTGVT